MKKHTFGIASSALSGLLVAVLFACNTPVTSIQPNSSAQNVAVASKLDLVAHPYAFQGNLQIAPKGFGVKATFDDFVMGSTINLYQADGVTPINGQNPVSTDANGNFTFVPVAGFTPVTGTIYTVQAQIRAGNSSSPLLTLKTLIRWNGHGYDSITGNSIFINTFTTALAIMADRGDITQNEAINNITVSNGVSTPHDILNSNGSVKVSANQIINVANLVTQSLSFQADPSVAITKNNGVYSLNSTTFNPTSSIDTSAANASSHQKDRLAIPSLNIVINGYNGFTKTAYNSLSITKAQRDTAKDLYNTESPANDVNNYGVGGDELDWGFAIHAVFPDTTSVGYANAIATALTPDVQTLDMSQATSFSYTPIGNPDANNPTEQKGNPTLNGRLLSDDVVDVELKTLSNVAGASDKVAFGSDGKTATNTFPYLSAPW